MKISTVVLFAALSHQSSCSSNEPTGRTPAGQRIYLIRLWRFHFLVHTRKSAVLKVAATPMSQILGTLIFVALIGTLTRQPLIVLYVALLMRLGHGRRLGPRVVVTWQPRERFQTIEKITISGSREEVQL